VGTVRVTGIGAWPINPSLVILGYPPYEAGRVALLPALPLCPQIDSARVPARSFPHVCCSGVGFRLALFAAVLEVCLRRMSK